MWVDTCCIDKQGSAELSETILNSMYRWHANSGICYTYLHDVHGLFFPTDRDDMEYQVKRLGGVVFVWVDAPGDA